LGGCFRGLFSIIAIIFIIGVAASVFNGPSKPSSTANPGGAAAALRTPQTIDAPALAQPWEQVTLSDQKFEKGGFGSVALARLTLKNTGTRAVRDVNLNCSFYGQSGSTISTSNVTVYKTIAGGKSVKSGELNLGFVDGQATNAQCRVIYAEWN
jgi:hypothetical protein